jgi:hypothetical protein
MRRQLAVAVAVAAAAGTILSIHAPLAKLVALAGVALVYMALALLALAVRLSQVLAATVVAAGLAEPQEAIQSAQLVAKLAARMAAAAAAEDVWFAIPPVRHFMDPAVRALRAQFVLSGLEAHAAHLHSLQLMSEFNHGNSFKHPPSGKRIDGFRHTACWQRRYRRDYAYGEQCAIG